MRIVLGLDSAKMTMVPNEDELNSEKNYYVYEWYIVDTGQVFYIGKGKGNRYKEKTNRHSIFKKIINSFACDVRIIHNGLSEYEALTKEEELFAVRENEGHVLCNVQTPNATNVFTVDEYTYMQAPEILIDRVDKHYFHITNPGYDIISKEKLLATHIKKQSSGGLDKLYIKEDILGQNADYKSIVQKYCYQVEQMIKEWNGKVYKSEAKSLKSIIIFGNIPLHTYYRYKEKGYDVYHLVDVLNYIESYNK